MDSTISAWEVFFEEKPRYKGQKMLCIRPASLDTKKCLMCGPYARDEEKIAFARALTSLERCANEGLGAESFKESMLGQNTVFVDKFESRMLISRSAKKGAMEKIFP